MALSIASGELTAPAGTGSQAYAVTSFTPKLVLFFCNNQAAGAAGPTAWEHFGVATGAAQQWSHVANYPDGLASPTPKVGFNTTHCIFINADNGLGSLVRANLTSLNADGFTLNWAVTTVGVPIQWVAIGGADLGNVFAGSFDCGAATGNVAVTAPGFPPKLTLFACSRGASIAAGDGSYVAPASEGSGLCIGAAISSSARWAKWNVSASGAAADTGQCVHNDRCLFKTAENGTTISVAADFVSNDANGFTINMITADDDSMVGYVCFAGADFHAAVGTDAQKTSTGTKAKTGLGIQPEFLLFSGTGATTINTEQDGLATFLGIAHSGAERVVTASDTNAADPSETGCSTSAAKAVRYATGATPTVVAEADRASFDSDGYTLDYTTADAVARLFGLVAMRGAIAGGGAVGRGLTKSVLVERRSLVG